MDEHELERILGTALRTLAAVAAWLLALLVIVWLSGR